MRRSLSTIIMLLLLALTALLASCHSGLESLGTPTPADLSNTFGKPQPVAEYFKGCPPSGDAGDPLLNTLKNRIDETQWQPTTIAALLALTWPSSIENQPRSHWGDVDKQAIAQHEGTPVQIEGYFVMARSQSPESCNCHSKSDVDFHIWIVDDPNKDRDQSIVAEVTPRVRADHTQWAMSDMTSIVRNKEHVRISGWLLMDPEHPDQIGQTRGTIWEIHPIMQIETFEGGHWTPLDDGTTGVQSMGVAPQTAPVVTPVSTATQPPAGNPNVQDNKTVQISNIFYNGTKGTAEPDEYVEITNRGTEPVDMTDWVLQDDGAQHTYVWDTYTIKPGASIRVYTNEKHTSFGGFSFASGRAIWNNTGDVAKLYDSDHELVSRYAYGDKK